MDIRDGNTKQVNKSEYHEYSYYVSLSKNKIAVLDTRDNLTKQISLNEYYIQNHINLLKNIKTFNRLSFAL